MKPDPDPNHPTPGMHIWGWMSPVELEALMDIAVSQGSAAEIGCLHGRSAFALLTACPGPVYCIDPWDDEHNASFPSFMRNCGHFENLHDWQTTSTAAARLMAASGMQVDMTFIDGSHAYESVMVDIANWLPLTRNLICGHDYANADDGYPGVRQAVTEVFGDRVFIPKDTSIWCVNLVRDRTVAPGLPTHFDYTDEYDKHYVEDVAWTTG